MKRYILLLFLIAGFVYGQASNQTVYKRDSLTVFTTPTQVKGLIRDSIASIVIPDSLNDLASDATHRTVTDSEKVVWNAKPDTNDVYSRTALNAGQMDTRYYTESEVITFLAGKRDTTYLSGITSNIQQQINGKQNSLGFTPARDDSTYTVGEITSLLTPKFNTTDFGSYFNSNFTSKGLRQGAYLSDTTKFFLSSNFNTSFDSRLGIKTLDNIAAGSTNLHLTTTLKSNYDDAYSHSWKVTGNSVASKDTLPYQIHSFTTTQRDSWTPANGWLFRNSTLGAYQIYESGWQTLASGEWVESNYIGKTDTTDYVRYATSTAGYLPYVSRAGVLSNSGLYFNGTNVGNGTTAPVDKLSIVGNYQQSLGVYRDYDASISTAGTSIEIGAKDGSVLTSAVELIGNLDATGASNSGSFFVNVLNSVGSMFERLRIDKDGNVGISVMTFGTSAAKVLGLGVGTAPTSSPANMVQIYVKDVSSSAELFVRDEAGNETQLSAHALDAPDWMYDNDVMPDKITKEVNYYAGYVRFVNTTRQNKLQQKIILGDVLPTDANKKKFIVEETFADYNLRTGDTLKVENWEANQQDIHNKRKGEILQWENAKVKHETELQVYKSLNDEEKLKTKEPEFNQEKPKEYLIKTVPKTLRKKSSK